MTVFLPDPATDSESQLWQWYLSTVEASECASLSDEQLNTLRSYYREAGLETAWRRPYFRRHFSANFAEIASFVLQNRSTPRILDLGCGTGTQALYLALMGASVVGLDVDACSLDVMAKRKQFYERLLGKPLDLQGVQGNAVTVDLSQFGSFDAVYSLFAFNMMQPSAAVLPRITSWLKPAGRVAILDGNSGSWLSRLWPGRRRAAWSAPEAARELQDAGFRIHRHRGGVAIPPIAWALSAKASGAADAWLAEYLPLSISHLLLASSCAEGDRRTA